MADDELNGGVPPKAKPGAPRPITVRLKPVVKKTDTQITAEAIDKKASQSIPKETVIAASSGRTARVPIPALDDLVGEVKSEVASASATVKLRPVKVPGAADAPKAASPLKPVMTPVRASHKPGSNPLPPGPKLPSDIQVQAAKSKTSRISLDAAIGVAPEGPMSSGGAPKTIRLKRPAKLAGTGKMPTSVTSKVELSVPKSGTAPIGKTSRIPDEAMPPSLKDPTVTQKKTLKIKKKAGPAALNVGGDDSHDGVSMTPIADLDLSPVQEEGGAFTVIAGIAAIIAAVVVLMLTICLGAHAIGPAAGKNNMASVKMGMELPWPGRIIK
ncbi:MAG: hypothetical protein PF904_06465 [Kiritimatiellae bacterium]|jgi:hypothetical protein|nr:hypothetical protein [Kiritimatiellia bacterium]